MTAFPISMATEPAYPGRPDPTADVVIIGGGVIGVCTALFLARKHVAVTLLEKGRIAGEQSSRNWGWIRQQGRDEAELPIMVEARRLWQQFAQETGNAIGLAEGGVTYLARNRHDCSAFQDWHRIALRHGLDTILYDAGDFAKRHPGMQSRHLGAMFTASDMRAEPWEAVPALAKLATEAGARIVETCAARSLLIEAGRVAGVVTEAGTIRTGEVLLAGGAWSGLFAKAHGVKLPQVSVLASACATDPLPEVTKGGVTDDEVAFRRRRDGGYTLAPGAAHDLFLGPTSIRHATRYFKLFRQDVKSTRFRMASPAGFPDAWSTPRKWDERQDSPFERMRILNPLPNEKALGEAARRFAALFPELGDIRFKTTWGGMIDTLPDVVPVIDRVKALPGLTVATGMSGHGFGIGPGVGRVLADLITGGHVGHDLDRFRFSRFSDGSRLTLGPAL